MKFFRKSLFAIFVIFSCSANAQKTPDALDMMQGKTPAGLFADIPSITWVGNERYSFWDKGEKKTFEAKNGKWIQNAISPAPIMVKRAYIQNKDVFVQDENGVVKQITNDDTEEKNPELSPDGLKLAFTKNNNLYCADLVTGQTRQLTNDGTKTLLNGYATWIYWEEIFGRKTHFRAFWWSPNSKTIAYMRFDEKSIPMFPLYKSNGKHGSLEETRYPKAGDPNPEVKLGFLSAEGGATTWVDFGEPSGHQLGWPKFSPDGRLFVQWQNRGQDSLRIYAVNPTDGQKKEVYFETQKTWVDLSEADNRIQFIKNGAEMLIQSDQSGWNHLYRYHAEGGIINQVTIGNLRVLEVKKVDEKKGLLYFTARPLNTSAEIHLYRVNLNGTDLQKLTPHGFNHSQIEISPNNKYFTSKAENAQTPKTLNLYNEKGQLVRELATAKGPAFTEYQLAKTELIFIKSADGLFDLPAMVTWPVNMDPNKKYPMLVSIYGGPDAGNVMNDWKWTPQKQWYAQEGLIQVAFDHRGSGHFGKTGVNYMHRKLGYWEMEDYKTMARHLIDKGQADPTKICMTGFSYGGYMSCLAVTSGADVFTHAMAGGSVVDWHLYDSHYTERFMDLPSENPEGYKAGSVFSYLDRYKGKLLLVHGTMDDNVHMQNTIQLVEALQEKGKDFELMLYPNGRHGWAGLPELDKHFKNLQKKFIYKNLLEKEPPKYFIQ